MVYLHVNKIKYFGKVNDLIYILIDKIIKMHLSNSLGISNNFILFILIFIDTYYFLHAYNYININI